MKRNSWNRTELGKELTVLLRDTHRKFKKGGFKHTLEASTCMAQEFRKKHPEVLCQLLQVFPDDGSGMLGRVDGFEYNRLSIVLIGGESAGIVLDPLMCKLIPNIEYPKLYKNHIKTFNVRY